jgi:hypothetical protein
MNPSLNRLWMFNTVVAAAFVLEIYNLYELGHGRIHYLILVSIYTLFAISEVWIAIVDKRKAYWLFVALSIFGVIQGATGYARQ